MQRAREAHRCESAITERAFADPVEAPVCIRNELSTERDERPGSRCSPAYPRSIEYLPGPAMDNSRKPPVIETFL